MNNSNGKTIRDTGPDVHDANPIERFQRLVQERLRNGALTYEEAVKQVQRKHPELVQRIRAGAGDGIRIRPMLRFST